MAVGCHSEDGCVTKALNSALFLTCDRLRDLPLAAWWAQPWWRCGRCVPGQCSVRPIWNLCCGSKVPHNFGRKLPPAITTLDMAQKEHDLLDVLGDIATGVATTAAGTDANYKALNCKLKPVDSKSKEYKYIHTSRFS